MCGPKVPDPPKPVANPELVREREQAERDMAEAKAERKRLRTEDQLAILSGRMGRKSLFTGAQGGAGYAAPLGRSLFEAG